MSAPTTTAASEGFAKSASRLWRAARTGVAFSIFGLLGLFAALVGVPVVRLSTRDPGKRERRIQQLIQRLFRVFCGVLEGLGLARITWSGVENVERPGRLVIANHPTLIDAVAIMACMPQAICVAKEDTFSNFFMRGGLKAAGYVTNREGPQVVDACTDAIRAGKSLLLFPEGTRSPEAGMRAFKRGAAHVALRSRCEIVPVSVTCEPPTLMKGQKWWDVPDHRFHLHVHAGAPLRAAEIVDSELPRSQAARALTEAIRESIVRGSRAGGALRSARASASETVGGAGQPPL